MCIHAKATPASALVVANGDKAFLDDIELFQGEWVLRILDVSDELKNIASIYGLSRPLGRSHTFLPLKYFRIGVNKTRHVESEECEVQCSHVGPGYHSAIKRARTLSLLLAQFSHLVTQLDKQGLVCC
jgi:hypothetical protein